MHVLPEQPVLSIPPIVAPGAGSSYEYKVVRSSQRSPRSQLWRTGKNNGMPAYEAGQRHSGCLLKSWSLTLLLESLVQVHPSKPRLAHDIRVGLCKADYCKPPIPTRTSSIRTVYLDDPVHLGHVDAYPAHGRLARESLRHAVPNTHKSQPYRSEMSL